MRNAVYCFVAATAGILSSRSEDNASMSLATSSFILKYRYADDSFIDADDDAHLCTCADGNNTCRHVISLNVRVYMQKEYYTDCSKVEIDGT